MSMAADYASDEILLMDDDAPSESLPSMPIPSAPPPAPLKPSSSTRLLVLLLQAAVMALALLLFFLFAGIAALVLVHLFVAGRALRRRRTSGLGPFHGNEPGSRAGLSKDELRRLPSTRYASRGRLAVSLRWPDCAVCLEGLRDGDRCRVLPGCGHGFHKACVDKWLVRTPACPLCRAAVGAGVGSAGGRR